MILERWIRSHLNAAIKRQPASLLLGARQVGKTTLALQVAEKTPSVYLDLLRHRHRERIADAEAFLSKHREKLVILDEIHHAPELFSELRGLIDEGRREGRKAGQYLILGSATQELLRQTAESLTGRIAYVEMGGINALEILGGKESLERLWLRGGYPQCYLEESEDVRRGMMEDLVSNIVTRDIPDFGSRPPEDRMRRMLTMLSHLQGGELNSSKLGSNLDISGKTVTAHIALLKQLFLVRALAPWHTNVKKRLVKSPRIYLRDSGLAHGMLRINDFEDLMSHPVVGGSYEGFVIENLIAVSPPGTMAHYYRTSKGEEIDLLLEVPGRGRWAIEVKLSRAPKVSAGFHQACRDVGATRKFVVYPGDDEYAKRDEVTVIPLQMLMRELAEEPVASGAQSP